MVREIGDARNTFGTKKLKDESKMTFMPVAAIRTALVLVTCLFSITHVALAVVLGEDNRNSVGPYDSDHAAAVGMVYCAKEVMVNGERKLAVARTTATLVGNTQTVLTAGHAFFGQDKFGYKTRDYKYQEDCEYRKYQEDGSFNRYDIIYAKTGKYRGIGTHRSGDWAVLKLAKKAKDQKYLIAALFPLEALTLDSEIPVTVLGHTSDIEKQNGDVDTEGLYWSNGYMTATDVLGRKAYAHTADTSKRTSGAAIVYTRKDGSRLVYGIHVSSFKDRDLNRFVPTNPEVFNAIEEVMGINGV